MAFTAPTRNLEFSEPSVHVGWRGGCPLYVVFSLKMAEILFDNFERPVAICVAPPHAAVAESYEQAVHFFSAGSVQESVSKAYFDERIAP